MAISSLADFREYVRNRLGGGVNGVINVELSVDHLNQSIEDSVQTFQRYNYGEGLYEDWMVLNLVAGVSAYSTSGSDVEDIVGFSLGTTNNNSINQLFTPANLVLGGSFNSISQGGQGMALTNYQTAMLFLRSVEDIFSVKHRVDFRESQQTVVITPTPTQAMVGLMKVYRKETASNVYNHVLVKKLAIANAKQVWGKILFKFGSMALPGGGTYGEFGNAIWQEGKEEAKEIEDKMRNEGEPFGFTIG